MLRKPCWFVYKMVLLIREGTIMFQLLQELATKRFKYVVGKTVTRYLVNKNHKKKDKH
jgi:hypothetical protein